MGISLNSLEVRVVQFPKIMVKKDSHLNPYKKQICADTFAKKNNQFAQVGGGLCLDILLKGHAALYFVDIRARGLVCLKYHTMCVLLV